MSDQFKLEENLYSYFLNSHHYNCIEEPKGNKGGIYLGNYDAAKDENFIQEKKIGFMVSAIPKLLSDIDTVDKYQIKQHKVEIQDQTDADIYPFLDSCADFIHEAVQNGNILVHCAAGISRSTTCLMSYFIKYRKMTFEKALTLIKNGRSIATPNQGFQIQLKKFEKNYVEINRNLS